MQLAVHALMRSSTSPLLKWRFALARSIHSLFSLPVENSRTPA